MDFPLSNLGRDAELASLRSRLAEAEARVKELEGPACKNCFGHKLTDARNWVTAESLAEAEVERDRLREALVQSSGIIAGIVLSLARSADFATYLITCQKILITIRAALSPAPEPEKPKEERCV